jgi:hypothetical protein
MISHRFGVLRLLWFLFAVLPQSRTADLVITGRMHHLRSGAEREWAEFPEHSEGSELALTFEVTRSAGEQTLRVRHRDVKQSWRVSLNGTDVARLPLDEADMLTYWVVPAGTLRDGANNLRIYSGGGVSDDVMIGHVALIDRPRAQVLSESSMDISVLEEPGGRGIPSRITVADEHGTLVSLGNESGPDSAVRPGVVYSRTGAIRLLIPPGRYVVYAGRGFEYSVARESVNLVPGRNPARRLSIRREVDTAGWAAMDTHIHTGTFARHGDADIAERMLTLAGEGIELPVSTEHNMRVGFDAPASRAEVSPYFTSVAGSEVTTPSLGHFNVFPIGETAKIDERAPSWTLLRDAISRAAPDAVVVLNHGLDVHGGFRPLDRGRHIAVAGENLEGGALPANAMEVINSGAVMTEKLALPNNWMALLNRGVMLTPIGSSDSHDVSRYIVGQGRTYVRCEDGNPGRVALPQAIASVRRGQVAVSYGLLVEIDVHGKGPGELVEGRNGLDVRVRVKGPGWSRAQQVALYVNGMKIRDAAIKDGARAGTKWEETWRVPRPAHDVHLVAVANGPGVTEPFWPSAKPYQPTSIEFTPYVLGVSGAIFIDADESGAFESAFEYARREVAAASDMRSLVTKLASYDSAVALQAASVLRARDADAFPTTARSIVRNAPAHVAAGFQVYLDAWSESQAAPRK